MSKNIIAVLGLSLGLGLSGIAFADNVRIDDHHDNAQQQRMKDCNDRAGDKKGNDRQNFIKACLSNQGPGPVDPRAVDHRNDVDHHDAKITPQQQRMKDCNARAGNKKGNARKNFMRACLKK